MQQAMAHSVPPQDHAHCLMWCRRPGSKKYAVDAKAYRESEEFAYSLVRINFPNQSGNQVVSVVCPICGEKKEMTVAMLTKANRLWKFRILWTVCSIVVGGLIVACSFVIAERLGLTAPLFQIVNGVAVALCVVVWLAGIYLSNRLVREGVVGKLAGVVLHGVRKDGSAYILYKQANGRTESMFGDMHHKVTQSAEPDLEGVKRIMAHVRGALGSRN